VVARGAGAEMRQAMGIAVFAGMIGVTLFGLFLTPVFYVTLMRLRWKTRTVQKETALTIPPTGQGVTI
jgi:multidrug efflux pump